MMFNSHEAESVLARSIEDLKTKNHFNAEAWGLGSCKRWDADLEAGTIRFSNADDWVITADVQVIGTYNANDSTWIWAWDHPSVAPKLAQHARTALEFGINHDLRKFKTRKLSCTEAEAWELTAVACYLAKAQGAYRGPFGATLVFMTFGEVSIQKMQ